MRRLFSQRPAFSALAFGILFMAGCGPFARTRPVPRSASEGTERSVPVVVEDIVVAGQTAVVWTPSLTEDLLAAATFFFTRPLLKVTAVLPDNAFDSEEKGRQAWQALSELVARGQMEVVMTIPGEPPLALIDNTDVAKNSAKPVSLPPRFSWPEDALGHLSLARSSYRRRWRKDPPGVVMPGGVLAGPEVVSLQKVGVRWVLLLEGEGQSGYFGGLPISVVRPFSQTVPAGTRKGPLEGWPPIFDESVSATVPPSVRVSTLEQLQSLEMALAERSIFEWKTVSEIIKAADDFPVWPGLDRELPDFSPWIGEADENAAWRLLGLTRQAVEDYKNSGQAVVKNLDLALREIYQAESGRYFRALDNDQDPRRAEIKQEFLATLAQTYRILGQPVPGYLLEDFSVAAPPSSGDEPSRTGAVFKRGDNSWHWSDPSHDDRGPGEYFYPVGREYAPGSWDISTFEVRLGENNISFLFEMTSLTNPWNAPYGFSLPLIDVYVDINQLSGAGAETLLQGRPGIVESQNAWEYALSVDGWGARFYQYNPRLAARKLTTLQVKALPARGGFRVDVPRRYFRGNPDRWGFGLCVMGLDPQTTGAGEADPRPMSVTNEPDSRHFGGAWEGTAQAGAGRQAPPFLDILVPSGQTQSQVLGVYKQGRDVVLPFVRPEY